MEKKKVEINNQFDNNFKEDSVSKRSIITLECEKLFQISCAPINAKQLWQNYLEISNILNKIKLLEKTKTIEITRIDAIPKFMVWLEQNGAIVNDIYIDSFPHYGLGLRAKKDFKKDDFILKIPRKLIFNVHTAASELKAMQTDILIQHMPQVALAMALLIEKNKQNSEWKPYLNILPKEYCTVLYMNIEDMKELKGSPSQEDALKISRNISRQFSYFKKIFQNSNNAVSNLLRDSFTYEEYCWAVSTVMTRQNIIPNDDGLQTIHSLIPMWDMCNHEEGKITTDFDKTSNCCKCYAMRNFELGEQIFIHYGSRSNLEFFIHSGFIYYGNKNDSYKLRLGLSESDPLYEKRRKLLERINLPAVYEYLIKLEPEPINGLLLGFLRIFHMNESDLETWLKMDSITNITEKCFFFENGIDGRALIFLINRLNILSKSYPTSIKDDIKLLSTTSKQCRKLILQIRITEKKLLHCLIETLESSKSLNK